MFIFAGLSNTSMEEADFADLLVTNAFIYTSDPFLPFADSMAVKNGRILRLGNYSSFQVSLLFLPFFLSISGLLLQMILVSGH